MNIDYRTYQQVCIYLNKIKKAKNTLRKLAHDFSFNEIDEDVQLRISIFEKIEANVLAIFINHEEQLPYIPLSRCSAITYWYDQKSIDNIKSKDSILQILYKGDEKFIQDSNLIVRNEKTPISLKKVFYQFTDTNF
tara:strand:+ start:23079 stop:23486 length:408 start_codon:yes stop_codon:yes gene_type:complete